MDWSNERYCRLYIRDSVTWSLWPWEARALFVFILRKVDRAGILDLGGHDPAEAIAAVSGMPLDVVEAHLPALLKSKAIEIGATAMVMANYIEAQEATSSDKQRQSESRARRRDRARAGSPVTERDETSRGVTDSHDGSQRVTLNRTVPSQAVPSRTEFSTSELASEPTEIAPSHDAPGEPEASLGSEDTSGVPKDPHGGTSQASEDVAVVEPVAPTYIHDAYEAASYLFAAIRSHKPDFLGGKTKAQIEVKLTGWTKHLDLLIRTERGGDGKSLDEVKRVIDYCHRSAETFNRGKVQSGHKLRARFEQLSTDAAPSNQKSRGGIGERAMNYDFEAARARQDKLLGVTQ